MNRGASIVGIGLVARAGLACAVVGSDDLLDELGRRRW